MALFVCGLCLSIDNTACAPDYWRQRLRAAHADSPAAAALCTGCSEGAWHDRFPRRQYAPTRDGPLGPDQVIHPELQDPEIMTPS